MVVRRMNPLGQRLIAAGAQPERAQQFVERAMFDKGAAITKPMGMKAPVVLGDLYDEESQAASQALYPKGFRPPTLDDPQFPKYYDFVFGKGAYSKVFERGTLGATTAPNYATAKNSTDAFDQGIIKGVESGATYPQMVLKFEQAYKADKTIIGALTKDEALKYMKDIWTEYNKGKGNTDELLTKSINSNQNFKFGLPDPKMRYGLNTDYSKGTVDILTNPTVAKAYQKFVSGLEPGDPSASQKTAGFLARAVQAANKAGRTPYLDEARRREALRGKKIGG
jgi:hypothetical protein